MKKAIAVAVLICTVTCAHGQFSCTPKVASEMCKAAEAGSFMALSVQKDLNLIVADPIAFVSEQSQLETRGKVRCEAASKTNNPREMNRCATQAMAGISSNVLLEVSPDGSLQKIVVSIDYFRGIDNAKTRFVPQVDGTSKAEVSYSEPSPSAALEKMTQIGFFVLGYNSGQINYMSRNF